MALAVVVVGGMGGAHNANESPPLPTSKIFYCSLSLSLSLSVNVLAKRASIALFAPGAGGGFIGRRFQYGLLVLRARFIPRG